MKTNAQKTDAWLRLKKPGILDKLQRGGARKVTDMEIHHALATATPIGGTGNWTKDLKLAIQMRDRGILHNSDLAGEGR